jgi:hypothetical protein
MAKKSVQVLAHTRKLPARNRVALDVPTTAQHTQEMLSDNAFMGANVDALRDAGQPVSGISGEPAVNHLKAAVGLLRRKRA